MLRTFTSMFYVYSQGYVICKLGMDDVLVSDDLSDAKILLNKHAFKFSSARRCPERYKQFGTSVSVEGVYTQHAKKSYLIENFLMQNLLFQYALVLYQVVVSDYQPSFSDFDSPDSSSHVSAVKEKIRTAYESSINTTQNHL